MTENSMPELTLTPSAAAEEAPQLVLGGEPPAAAEPAKQEAEPVKLDDSMLTEAERKMVDDFSKKIDITNSQMVLEFGSAAQ